MGRRPHSVNLHLLDLGGDIADNGLSRLFMTIAAAFAELERYRIRERNQFAEDAMKSVETQRESLGATGTE